jgi:hypothetical protein
LDNSTDPVDFPDHFHPQRLDYSLHPISIQQYDDYKNQQYKYFDHHHQHRYLQDKTVDLIDYHIHFLQQ